MFERFTERARRVLFFARYEASQLGSASIDTEHLLLGLIREGKGLSARLFADAGIVLDDLRGEVLRRVPTGPPTPTSLEIPFSAAAKHVLQHAAEEADRLSHDYIGTEHLLLGLLREQGSVAADVLTSRGLRLDSGAREDRRVPQQRRAAGAPWATGRARKHVQVALAALPAVTHRTYPVFRAEAAAAAGYQRLRSRAAGLWLHAHRSHRPRLGRQPLAHRHHRRARRRHAVRLLHPVRADRTVGDLRADVARWHRAAVRPVRHARDATARCLGRQEHRAGRTDAAPLRRGRSRASPLEWRISIW